MGYLWSDRVDLGTSIQQCASCLHSALVDGREKWRATILRGHERRNRKMLNKGEEGMMKKRDGQTNIFDLTYIPRLFQQYLVLRIDVGLVFLQHLDAFNRVGFGSKVDGCDVDLVLGLCFGSSFQ